MAQQRLPMRNIRDVLRLKAAGMSKRKIAAGLGIGATAAGECLARALRAGVGWPLPDDMTDAGLEARLYPASTVLAEIKSRRPHPDWPAIHRELKRAGVTLQLNCRVAEVTKPGAFRVATSHGVFSSASLVVATGGLSFPKIGATDFGYRLARQFEVKITATRPGLVPVMFAPVERQAFAELSGISLDVEVSANEAVFRENLLFTHRGLSGPAILQISNYFDAGESFIANLLPELDATALLLAQRQSGKELKTVLAQHLPARFTQAWCERFAESKPMHRYSGEELETIARQLQRWEITPADTEGYSKAEVTVGGVDTNELSSKTMESRRVPGLYFVGEVVDVTGWLGGYNFQWAWASGHAAGQCA